MNYIQVLIDTQDADQKDLLIALLSEANFEGFEETDTALVAFIPEADWQETQLAAMLGEMGLSYSKTIIEPRNWNAEWESDFEPVHIGDFCTIRAHFHPEDKRVQHEIIITPKMSFGTGHHATTRLMVESMASLDFSNARVLDFGTGTGVLAILAEKLGALEVDAIDNDEWSYTNASENLLLNDSLKVSVSMQDISVLQEPYDYILANINRHILLAYMAKMYALLPQGGTLLMSGLLSEDEAMVVAAAEQEGFNVKEVSKANNWISILCTKA